MRIPSTVLTLVREHYPDFGPTLAVEKLAARQGLHVGVETLRQWMMSDGLWKDRRHRLPSPHQPRRRRDCLGELVQIYGSEHAWFEDRGAVCTLLTFVDDATSRLMTLRFVVWNRPLTISGRRALTWTTKEQSSAALCRWC